MRDRAENSVLRVALADRGVTTCHGLAWPAARDVSPHDAMVAGATWFR